MSADASPIEQHLDTKTFGNAENEALNVRPLRIALLGYRSHPFVGGQGIYLKYLSRALKSLGHKVDVYSGPPYPELDNDIPLFKVPSLDLYSYESVWQALEWKHLTSFTDLTEIISKLTGGFAEPFCFGRRVAQIFRPQHLKNTYDIIHDNQSLCSGLLNLQKGGHTVVSTLHHPIHRDRELAINAAQRWSEKLLVRRWYSFLNMQEYVVKNLNHVITVSKSSQKDIEYHFKRPASDTPVIFNGIDTGTFRPIKHINKIPYRLLTTASSDQPLKGLDILLKALSKLKSQYSNIHLEIIGILKKGGQTEKLLKELNLQNYVSFSSKLSTKKLVEKYNQAMIVVCPSLYEGFGLPAAEAMSCGAAVISSDGGALPEVVADAGIIVEKANDHALAKAIERLFLDEVQLKHLQKTSRERIKKTFSWKKVAVDLSAFYEKILTEKTSIKKS